MSGTYFTEEHEWIRVEDDGSAEVGLTDYAQDQLGELVFVELPEVGAHLQKGAEAAVVESVKAAGELYAPASGTVTEVNDAIVEDPGLVNRDPMGDGWFFRMQLDDPGELEDLMDEEAYRAYVEGLE